MSLAASEIEYGRLAIERNLATPQQIRECADLRAQGNQEHIARLLVSRGYLTEGVARDLYRELSGSNGGHRSPASSYGPGGTSGGVHATCPSCGARTVAPADQAGQRIRCEGCGGGVPVPGPAGADPGSGYFHAGGGPHGTHGYGPTGTHGYGSNYASGPAPSGYGAPAGSGYGAPAGSGYGAPAGSGYGAPAGSGYGAPAPAGSGYGAPAGSGYGAPGYGGPGYGAPAGSGFGAAAGTPIGTPVGYGPAGAGFGPAGTGYPDARGGPGGTAVVDPVPPAPGAFDKGQFFDTGEQELPPNIAPDDPIAHAMSVRQNSDGSVETVFGPYDVIGEIARGGMGIVYRARQRSLKRIVALKVMKEGENASEKQVRRFKRETEAAAKLQHPKIVAVHEVGCHEGFHYFTMDLIEGDPLDAIIKRGEKLPVDRILQVVMEVAQAIHYAHGKGIIHRDLKPANVLLDTDGHPKVTDFGLAKNIDHKSMLTRTGAVVGTPFYMPPEQARGDVDIDQRADVYALGVILYELLTLKLPFHGETTMEVYHKILEDEPLPPRRHDSRVNVDINTIVLKAMEKDLARRYQTALELAEDIQRYLNGDPIKARPLGPIGRTLKKAKKNMPVVVVATVTALAFSGAVGLIFWRRAQVKHEIWVDNVNTEWDTYVTEVDNQRINARSQIASGVARQRDRDPEGALADLNEALKILEDLPFLAQEYTNYNTEEATLGHLDERKPEIDQIYRDVYLEMGKAHVLQGDEESYGQAVASFEEGLEYDPDSHDLYLEIGRVETLQGQHEAALATFAGILEDDPEHMDARLETGRVHDRAGAPLEALTAFTQVIDYDRGPVDKEHLVRAHLLRGQTRFRIGRYDQARKDFDRVLDLRDDHFDGYVWRGRVHQALGHWGEAQDDLTEAIDLNPSLPDGYFHRAELYFAQRKHAEAIKDYEVAISRSAQYYPAYLGLGRALEWVLDYERARQQYEEILAADGRAASAVAPEALAALATLDLTQADVLECRQEEEERLRLETASEDGALGPPPPLDTLTAAGARLRERRLDSARRRFDEALETSEGFVPALVGRARLAVVSGDLPGARRDLEAALRALDRRLAVLYAGDEDGDGGSDDGWDDDGWEEDDVDDLWDEEDDELVTGDEPLAEAQALLGVVALREGDPGAAQDAFEAALEAYGSSAFAKAGLGHVALARGSDEDARELFEEARELAREGQDEAGYFLSEGLRFEQLASRSKKPEYYKQARQSFARAMARNPYDAVAALERSKLSASWSGFDVAVALAERCEETDPYLREAYELKGFLFTRELPLEPNPETGRPANVRDHERARAEFDRAIEVAASTEAAADSHYGRALALLALDDGGGELVAQARVDLERAIEAIPEDFAEAEPRRINQSIAYLEKLSEVYERLGMDAEADATLARVAEVRQAAKEAATAELEEGRVLRDRLNYSEAIEHFDRATELDPKFDEAYYDRGTCYLKIGNFVPGILDFSRALELNPRIADQVYNKVYQISYVVDLNRVITELNKIVSDHPNVSYVIFLRGFFYVAKTEFKEYDRQDLDLGIADFDRCLELNPTHVTALLYRGFLWFKMAQLEEEIEKKEESYQLAMDDYLHALELDPESGISHYLQALLWSQRSSNEFVSDAEREEFKQRAFAELALSFESNFKGYERIKNERGFEPIRDEQQFIELMRGK